MPLTVLSIAYPFAPVSPDAVGGAEQVLARIDSALVAGGHRSIVLACDGSRTAGELVTIPRTPGALGQTEMSGVRARYRELVADTLAKLPVDVIHMHGLDFHHYLPSAGPPVLVTLHLPVNLYPAEALFPRRPRTWLHCVSAFQHRTAGKSPHILPPIENGVPLRESPQRRPKSQFALMLSRICPEKGVHLAIEAAKLARLPLVIGGEIFPYPHHRRYFEDEVVPRLDRARRFLGPVGGALKQRLLAAARCVVVPSLIAETSSLTAREALAAGTPVIAFRSGALAETIEEGRTGYLVDDVTGMARAMTLARLLSPQVCRSTARERFSLSRMIAGYFSTYRSIMQMARRAQPAPGGAA